MDAQTIIAKRIAQELRDGMLVGCNFGTYGWEAGEHGYDFAQDEAGRASFAQLLNDVLSGTAAMPS